MKKIMSIALSLCLVAAMVGCGSQDSSQTTAPSSQPTEQATNGTIVMGTNAEFPPFEYVSNTEGVVENYAGIDVEIAQAIAKKLGKELKIENTKFDSLLAEMANGKCDFVAAGMTIKPDRLKNADFSDTYYTAIQKIITAKDSTIAKAEDLKSAKKVGVITGYTGDFFCSDSEEDGGLGLTKDQIVRYNRGTDAVMELINGKIDAVVIDSLAATKLSEKNDILKIVSDDEFFGNEEYAIAVKKGNKELLTQINEVLKELKDSGEIDKISDKYNSK